MPLFLPDHLFFFHYYGDTFFFWFWPFLLGLEAFPLKKKQFTSKSSNHVISLHAYHASCLMPTMPNCWEKFMVWSSTCASIFGKNSSRFDGAFYFWGTPFPFTWPSYKQARVSTMAWWKEESAIVQCVRAIVNVHVHGYYIERTSKQWKTKIAHRSKSRLQLTVQWLQVEERGCL